MKKTYSTALISALAVLCLLAPLSALASTIYIETDNTPISVGDTIVARVYLDADVEGNALDGSIDLSGAKAFFALKDMSLGGSVLTLWPHEPSLSTDGMHITFTGGTPGGFSGSHQLLFTMALTARASGTATISPSDSVLYLNDGKGTPRSVAVRSLLIPVSPAQEGVPPRDSWQAINENDTTPPLPFVIYAGQDPSVYEGKKYIFFETTDAQSGIDHYEVKEGTSAPVRSSTTYVLQDQAHSQPIIVFAYDKVGNVRTSVYPSAGSDNRFALEILLAVIGAILVFWYARRQRGQ